MSFSPDGTANLPPRTCPSSIEQAKAPPPTPVGGGRAVGDATVNEQPTIQSAWAERSAFIPSTTLNTANNN
jgi:hypothetical protein